MYHGSPRDPESLSDDDSEDEEQEYLAKVTWRRRIDVPGAHGQVASIVVRNEHCSKIFDNEADAYNWVRAKVARVLRHQWDLVTALVRATVASTRHSKILVL